MQMKAITSTQSKGFCRSGKQVTIYVMLFAAVLLSALCAMLPTGFAVAEDASGSSAASDTQVQTGGNTASGLTAGTPANQAKEQAEETATKPFTGSGIYYIQLPKTKDKVLGMKDDKRVDGTAVVVSKKRLTNLQRFKITSAGGGLFYIRNVATGRLLTANIWTKKNTGYARMNVKSSEKDYVKNYQKWSIVMDGKGNTVTITNAYTGSRLSLSGKKTAFNTRIKVTKPVDASYQKFVLKKSKKRANEIVNIGVPCYMQNPQLPTGCESVALTNALNYWGFHLSKTTIAARWMPYGDNGVTNFIGSPYNSSGWIICAPGIANTANKFLSHKGSAITATNVSGLSLSSLKKFLNQGYPVVVWTTMYMNSPGSRDGSKVVDGYRYPLHHGNHAVVLSGYNPKNGKYLVADSLSGKVWRNGTSFARIYNTMGKQAVVLHDVGMRM